MSALFACGRWLYLYNFGSMERTLKRTLPIWFAAPALLLSTPGAASKAEPPALKASSAWRVNFADDQCRLARIFGEGDGAVVLFVDRYAPGEDFLMTVSGKTIKSINPRPEAKVQFGPSEQEQQISFFNGNLGKEPAFLFSSARIAQPSEAEILANKDRQELTGRIFSSSARNAKKPCNICG